MGDHRAEGFKASVPPRGRRCGMSLYEMLVVVSILGIIVGIGVPILSAVIGTTKETVAKRNAQSFSAVSSCSL